MAQCRAKLPEISAGAGPSGVFDYGGRGHLLGSDPEHFRDGRRVRRDLAGNGLYGAAVLLPVQDRLHGQERVPRPLMTEELNMAYVPVPKDLNAVKTKVLLNLTKRQLVLLFTL